MISKKNFLKATNILTKVLCLKDGIKVTWFVRLRAKLFTLIVNMMLKK